MYRGTTVPSANCLCLDSPHADIGTGSVALARHHVIGVPTLMLTSDAIAGGVL
jgi:hypothetical protein